LVCLYCVCLEVGEGVFDNPPKRPGRQKYFWGGGGGGGGLSLRA